MKNMLFPNFKKKSNIVTNFIIFIKTNTSHIYRNVLFNMHENKMINDNSNEKIHSDINEWTVFFKA